MLIDALAAKQGNLETPKWKLSKDKLAGARERKVQLVNGHTTGPEVEVVE